MPTVCERRSQSEEKEVATGHEGVWQAIFAQRDLGVARKRGLTHLAEDREIEHMVGPEPVCPFWPASLSTASSFP